MNVSDFDYDLPEELIAQEPVEPRDHSRLMVVDIPNQTIEHRHFYDLVDYLQPNDVLVVNESRVIPARLYGVRKDTLGKIEVLLIRPLSDKLWEVLVKPGKRCKVGTEILFSEQLKARVVDYTAAGGRIVEFDYSGDFDQILEILGETPLPPYIKKQLPDRERYQTVYATIKGSVAAPTAGLHFTPTLLQQIKDKGIKIVPILLHVGIGTFRPVKVERVEDHHMHAEYYSISAENAQIINNCKQSHGRVIAVGTTVVRTLETVGRSGKLSASSGWTDIFIYPGFEFKIIDGLITNFHLPKSSLLMLVSAFAGSELIKKVYQTAIEQRYRFFSFGDASLLLKRKE